MQNCWVVPHSPYLSAKYDAHINVEICANVKACKYIFKYVHKGGDRASLWIEQENGNDVIADPVDEIQEYRDARWVGSAEACWRIFAFKLHDHGSPIKRLSIYLLNQHTVLFDDDVDLSEVVDSAADRVTTLTAFFQLNQKRQQDGQAGDLFYTDLPEQYVWKKGPQRGWSPRQRGRGTIARMFYINPNVGELFYLRFLLLNIPSPKLFEDLRITANWTLLPTFHGACTARGLLHNDAKWDQALGEARAWQGGACLRSLFVTILLNCQLANPLDLWNNHKSRYVCGNNTALLAVLKHHHFFLVWCCF